MQRHVLGLLAFHSLNLPQALHTSRLIVHFFLGGRGHTNTTQQHNIVYILFNYCTLAYSNIHTYVALVNLACSDIIAA